MKDKVNYTAMTDEQLTSALSDERETVQRLRINHAVSQLENPNVIGASKQAIARILTEQTRRSLSLQPQNQTADNGAN
jgi:ribosomal protein L29